MLSLAGAGLFRPRWSARILDETQKAISEITDGATDGSRQRASIEAAFPESPVAGCEVVEGNLDLVLAAAISTSASVIVTDNLGDFPTVVRAPHAIHAISADDFLADTIELDPSEAILALRRMRERFENPAIDVLALIHESEAQGLLQVATLINQHKSLL